MSWIPLDSMLRFSQRVTAWFAGALYIRDWQLEARGRPQFFKQQINLARWRSEPSRWAFAARGVYAREVMFKGCKVLDLCCGDGSYSYLFFSDIAGSIDAVDNDQYAIDYASKYHASPPIRYHKLDIVNQPLPSDHYDVVVWNAAICYFDEAQIRLVLQKIAAAGTPGMKLKGMLPRAHGWVDHKKEFADCRSVELFLRPYFATVAVREVAEGEAITFYFQASEPLHSRSV